METGHLSILVSGSSRSFIYHRITNSIFLLQEMFSYMGLQDLMKTHFLPRNSWPYEGSFTEVRSDHIQQKESFPLTQQLLAKINDPC